MRALPFQWGWGYICKKERETDGQTYSDRGGKKENASAHIYLTLKG